MAILRFEKVSEKADVLFAIAFILGVTAPLFWQSMPGVGFGMTQIAWGLMGLAYKWKGE